MKKAFSDIYLTTSFAVRIFKKNTSYEGRIFFQNDQKLT